MRFFTCMKKTAALLVFVSCIVLGQATLIRAQGSDTAPNTTKWPTYGWAKGTPASVGLDEQVLLRLDKDMALGKYSQMMDSFAVFRCGQKVFEHTYPHDYAKLYGKEAAERGPLNARLTGRYNYFDPYWHPYYHGTDLHTMQSVSKTVTSIIIGAAMQRGDFKAGLDTPVLKYFDTSKVKNVDERKRRITLRDVLTMTTGLQWQEDVPYDDPRSDSSLMEATNDWVQYVIDKPMAAEPGKVWNYSSGVTELLAYIFQKETGQDIDDYGQKYLFAPLGIRHEWKRTYQGVVDTEGGLYLNGSDLAKIGYLYLHDGMWDGQRIVSSEWVKESVTPYFQTDDPPFKYGFKWWLSKLPDSTEYVWMARGFGGQNLLVFPNESLIVTFTAWDILPTSTGKEPVPSDFLPIVKVKTCTSAADGHPSTSEKQQVSKQGTQNPEAYALYSKGRSYFDKQTLSDLKTAVSYFNQAIAKDPGYALAYAGLARAYGALPDYGDSPVEDIPKAKAAARKAMELDPTLASPHVSLGGTMMAHDWDFAGGEAEFKKGLELDPDDAHAHEIYADNLSTIGGREQEALAEVNRAHQLDPHSLAISVEVGTVYIDARRFDDAIVVCKKVANENPTFAPAHACLADAYRGKKMYPQVIEEWKAYAQITRDRNDSEYASALEQGFRSGGWKGALNKSIETLQAQRKTGYSSAYFIAQAYADLGEKDQAFQWLNTTFQEHDEHLMWLKTDFVLDPIRSDPRFAELVRKVGLPQ
ncbi:MAG: serine hydrolase [Candidatus Sulfotelmatobacter sp.]|jgi:CubicO group peptidase (beta-lactamase class C family)